MADQQHIILILEPPLGGQSLASEVGWDASSETELGQQERPQDAAETSESGSEREAFLSLRICATCRGWPSLSCSNAVLAFSFW